MTVSPINLQRFLAAVYDRIDRACADPIFDPSQAGLLRATAARARTHATANPFGDPLAIFYLVHRSDGRAPDEQSEWLGAFCLLYILSLDLFDDAQDEDLAGKPHAEAGMAIAVNSAIALLFLALDALKRAIALEADAERRWAYLDVFNRISLLAVAGQHRDLMGAAGASTPEQVLAMQQAKTSSLALVAEVAALHAGCAPEEQARFREAAEAMVLLVQVVDDVRDVYGKAQSPDLSTRKMTYPLACFLETAPPEAQAEFEALVAALPASLPAIRQLWYDAGAIAASADAIERFRAAVHTALAATRRAGPALRTWLYIADGLAAALYELPELPVSAALRRPDGPWSRQIRAWADGLRADLARFDPPPVPPLLPWHLPQYMYAPDRQVIYYPDLEGLPEEIVPFQAALLGLDDLDRVRDVMKAQAPAVMAHEFFHYWRDAAGHLTQDAWYEELAANGLAVAYGNHAWPRLMAETAELATRVLARHPEGISPRGREILEALLSPGVRPSATPRAYEVSLEETALIQLEMVKRLCAREDSLEAAFAAYLPAEVSTSSPRP